MPDRITAWSHVPTARGTIYSGEDPANPDGWNDNLLQIKTFANSHTHTVPSGRTWAIPGDVATGMVVVRFFMDAAYTLKEAYTLIESGTSVTCKIQRTPWGGAAADLAAPYNSISVTTTPANIVGDISLAKGDLLDLVITAVSGSPQAMTMTLVLEGTSGA